jgi:hypothetical protein
MNEKPIIFKRAEENSLMDTGSLEMEGVSLERRRLLRLLLMAPLLSAFAGTAAEASPLNPSETFVMQPDQIQFKPWQGSAFCQWRDDDAPWLAVEDYLFRGWRPGTLRCGSPCPCALAS